MEGIIREWAGNREGNELVGLRQKLEKNITDK
jgi:hypothetical protein